jgi:hypothetical protein
MAGPLVDVFPSLQKLRISVVLCVNRPQWRIAVERFVTAAVQANDGAGVQNAPRAAPGAKGCGVFDRQGV